MPRPVNIVHSCSRTFFEDKCLLIILVDWDIPGNDKVNNVFPRMTGHLDSKLDASFLSEAFHSDPLQHFSVPSRCNTADGCVKTDRSIIELTSVDTNSGESVHIEFKVHCLRPNSSSILSRSLAFASLSALLPHTPPPGSQDHDVGWASPYHMSDTIDLC